MAPDSLYLSTEYSGDERVIAALDEHRWVEPRWFFWQRGRCTCGWRQADTGKHDHSHHVAAAINTALGIAPEQYMPVVATHEGTGLVYRWAEDDGCWYLLDFMVEGPPLVPIEMALLTAIAPVDMGKFR